MTTRIDLDHLPVVRAVTGEPENTQLECSCGWLWDEGDFDMLEGESFMRHALTASANAELREAVIHAARDVDGAWDAEDRDGADILWFAEAGEVLADLRTAVIAYDAAIAADEGSAT